MCQFASPDADRGRSEGAAQTLAVERFSPREAGPLVIEPCLPRHGRAVCCPEERPLVSSRPVTFEKKQLYTIPGFLPPEGKVMD